MELEGHLFSHTRSTGCALAIEFHVSYRADILHSYYIHTNSNIPNVTAVIILILLTFQLFRHENIKYKDKSCVSG